MIILGSFESSDPVLNAIHRMEQATAEANMMSIQCMYTITWYIARAALHVLIILENFVNDDDDVDIAW